MLSEWYEVYGPGHVFSAWGIFIFILTLPIGWLGRSYGDPFVRWLGSRTYEIFQAIRKLARARSAISPDSRGLWLASKIPIEMPKGYDAFYSATNQNRIPIIVVANLKGGVGKTTTAANLAAHYAIAKGEKVLLLDFDYQGSLTRMALSNDDYNNELKDQIGGRDCRASGLIDTGNTDRLVIAAMPVQDVPHAQIIPSFYSFATTENRIMVEWLLADRPEDIRYHLASILQQSRICERYNRIIIDAPPRLTTACVQALCAATHVIIPTVLDDLSAETVGTFAEQLKSHRVLWPNLNVLGLLGTMTTNSTINDKGELVEKPLNGTEITALQKAEDACKDAFEDAPTHWSRSGSLPLETFTPNKADLARAAGTNIAYAQKAQTPSLRLVRASFDSLGNEIDRRIGWDSMPPAAFG